MVVSWFVEEGVSPVRINDGGAAGELVVGGFRVSYNRLAMVAFDPLVTRWREARCRRRTLADGRANSATKHPLMSADGMADDIDKACGCVRLILGIATTTLVTE